MTKLFSRNYHLSWLSQAFFRRVNTLASVAHYRDPSLLAGPGRAITIQPRWLRAIEFVSNICKLPSRRSKQSPLGSCSYLLCVKVRCPKCSDFSCAYLLLTVTVHNFVQLYLLHHHTSIHENLVIWASAAHGMNESVTKFF